MSGERRGLWAAAAVGIAVVVALMKLYGELYPRLWGTQFYDHLSLLFLREGAIVIVIGLVAAGACRWLAVRSGASRRLAWGVGLAVGAASIAGGLRSWISAAVWTEDGIRDLPLLSQWDDILLAVAVVVALRIAQVPWLAVLGVAVGVHLIRYGVFRFDVVRLIGDDVDMEDYERIDQLERIRFWIMVVLVPALTASAAILLSRSSTSADEVAVPR